MAVYTDESEPEFEATATRHQWFLNVLLADYGEIPDAPPDAPVPAALDWPALLPPARRYDFEEAECGMVYVAPDGNYRCSVWDVTGPDDWPWAVFVVDDAGGRYLPEYSLLDDDMTDSDRDALLLRAADEIPDRAERGEFTRFALPLSIPAYLARFVPPDDESE